MVLLFIVCVAPIVCVGSAFSHCFVMHYIVCFLVSSPEPKAQGELIVWDSSQRPLVRPSVSLCVHTLKHEYL